MANMPLVINVGEITAIVDVVENDFPKFKEMLAASTGHEATSGYYQGTASGKRRIDPFSLTLAWDKSEETHTQVMNRFIFDATFEMEMQDPDGNETIAFSAHLEEVERKGESENIFLSTVSVHPTGPPTIT